MKRAKFLFGQYLNNVEGKNLTDVQIGVRWLQSTAEQKLDWIRFAEAVDNTDSTYNHEGI